MLPISREQPDFSEQKKITSLTGPQNDAGINFINKSWKS